MSYEFCFKVFPRKEGCIRALATLKEMLEYEDQVTIMIGYLKGKR